MLLLTAHRVQLSDTPHNLLFSNFGSSCNMTKRDSVAAGFTFSPMSMNFPRRHHRSEPHAGQSSDWHYSNAPGTSYTSHPEYPSWSTSHTPADVDQPHSSEITAISPPMPTSSQSGNQTPIIPSQEVNLPDWHPLQHQTTESRRQVHAHYFIEVSTPGNDPNSPTDRYLMVTEVDQHGTHRNRQPEYFFNGIVGHIRACRNGWIDSWTQSNQLANYWRRHFDIPEIRQHRSSTWWNYDDPGSQTSGHDPNMEDTDSVTAQVDNPPPVQIHQLATLLWNILNSDREANRAILERLEDAEEDLQRHPVQIFGAGDLAHLASHLAETTRTLANQAFEMEAMSDLSE